MARTKKAPQKVKRLSKKVLHNGKLTIIKVLPKNGTISQADLDRWHEVFRTNSMTLKEAAKTGEVKVEFVPAPEKGKHYITFVRVGSDEYYPTPEDLENWRDIFEEAAKDPDFKIFTHQFVDVKTIELGKVVAVE